MGLGEKVISTIEEVRRRRILALRGPLGDYYRSGGNDLLYNMPVTTGELVIDGGGYEGAWSARMISLYGCRSLIFEPIPAFADSCASLFAKNDLVEVRRAALGGSSRKATFSLDHDGSSEFAENSRSSVTAEVADIAQVISEQAIACLKLNIEGGEYEVLERLIESGKATQCRSILVQFHHQPPGWERRLASIREHLAMSHKLEWSYPLVWEKWSNA